MLFMTPIEKALELFDKYHYIEENLDENLFCDSCDYNRKLSKYCALIAVDYLMKESETMTSLDYWFNVKTEIEKL
jgi:hypothetical protein